MVARIGKTIIAFLLLAGLVYQLLGAWQYLINRYQNKTWANRNLDAFVRSADGSYGSDFAAVISLLRNSIPEQASVLIPPASSKNSSLTDLYLMQYFLFPRTIETCPSNCAALIAAPGIYIIAQDAFPASNQVPASKHLVAIAGSVGLYVPGK